MRDPCEPLLTDYTEFEVTNYDVEWGSFYDADIGGYDGKLPTCTIIEAEVETPDGDLIKMNRTDLLKIAGPEAVTEAEEALEDEQMVA